MKKSITSCMACGKNGHFAMIGKAPWRAYLCPVSPHPDWWGETGSRREDRRCSKCGGSGFEYSNGFEISRDGVRGYRCLECGTIKPELPLREL